jgi:hypothetical protein
MISDPRAVLLKSTPKNNTKFIQETTTYIPQPSRRLDWPEQSTPAPSTHRIFLAKDQKKIRAELFLFLSWHF